METFRDVGRTTVRIFRHKHYELSEVEQVNPGAVGYTFDSRTDKRSDTSGFRA